MRRNTTVWVGPAVVALFLSFSPGQASGQTLLTLSGGPAEYDLSGTGWSGVLGVHLETSLRNESQHPRSVIERLRNHE